MTSNTEILLELEMYLERYRKGLEDIITAIDDEGIWIDRPFSLAADIDRIARSALHGEPTTADKFNDGVTWVSPNDPGDENDLNKVQDHGPPYSMANPSGEPIRPHPLAAKYGIKDDHVNIGDDIEYKWVSPRDPGDEHDTSK